MQLNEIWRWKTKGAGPDPIYYDEALLAANHNGALTTDQQGVGEVNYLASDDYLADADDDRTVRTMGQRRMTDAEYRRKVDSLNESQCLAFQKVLNYTAARHEYQMHAVQSPPEPLRLFITGGTGTGKSDWRRMSLYVDGSNRSSYIQYRRSHYSQSAQLACRAW